MREREREREKACDAGSTADGSKQALFRWCACCGQRATSVSGSAELKRERGALSRGGPWAPHAPKKERKKERVSACAFSVWFNMSSRTGQMQAFTAPPSTGSQSQMLRLH